ncbi:hypothetical protein FKM82_028170 [Ascaphus truei]
MQCRCSVSRVRVLGRRARLHTATDGSQFHHKRLFRSPLSTASCR